MTSVPTATVNAFGWKLKLAIDTALPVAADGARDGALELDGTVDAATEGAVEGTTEGAVDGTTDAAADGVDVDEPEQAATMTMAVTVRTASRA